MGNQGGAGGYAPADGLLIALYRLQQGRLVHRLLPQTGERRLQLVDPVQELLLLPGNETDRDKSCSQ